MINLLTFSEDVGKFDVLRFFFFSVNAGKQYQLDLLLNRREITVILIFLETLENADAFNLF